LGEKETAAESRYGGAQIAGGGMSTFRGAGDGGPDSEAQAAKGVAQVGLGVVGQRAVAPGGKADPSPAEALKHDHIYQHNESDLD
jgi:hypothetical protein